MRRLALFWVGSGAAIIGSTALLAVNPATSTAAASGSRASCTVASIHDADTLRADCSGVAEQMRVRFYCVDAPELAQKPWGQASRDALKSRLPAGSPVQIETVETDRYGRTVGKVYAADGEELNLWLVQQGRAAVYPQYCTDQRYFQAQSQAQAKRIGIWSADGLHQTPWNYRKQK